MPSFLRPFLARLLSPWVTAVAMSLGARIGHQYDAEFISQATMVVVEGVVWSLAVFVSLSGLIHKLINARINPSDAAAADVAQASADAPK